MSSEKSLSCVRFGSARYSVPSRLIGTTVLVELHGSMIRVLEPGHERGHQPGR